MIRRAIAAVQPLVAPVPVPDRGRWLRMDDVRALLGGGVSRDWVYRRMPHKVVLSRGVVGWWERDVRAWLEACERAARRIEGGRAGAGPRSELRTASPRSPTFG